MYNIARMMTRCQPLSRHGTADLMFIIRSYENGKQMIQFSLGDEYCEVPLDQFEWEFQKAARDLRCKVSREEYP